jgi:hypothetical protein
MEQGIDYRYTCHKERAWYTWLLLYKQKRAISLHSLKPIFRPEICVRWHGLCGLQNGRKHVEWGCLSAFACCDLVMI